MFNSKYDSFVLLVFFFVNCYAVLSSESNEDSKPCSFYDTVNITGASQFENGTYSYQGMLIPPELVTTYDFVPRFHSDNLTRVTSHLRGCVCGLRPCINFCCEWQYKYNYTTHRCDRTDEAFKWPAKVLKVGPGGSNEREVNIFEEFAVQYYRPCESMLLLRSFVDAKEEWHLLENGRISVPYQDDQITLQKNLLKTSDYCFVPFKGKADTEYIISVAYCLEQNGEFNLVRDIYAYGMFISIPCMVATIIVYLIMPQLRNLHGKALVCYLTGLVFGYSVIACHTTVKSLDWESMSCKLMGYTGYFFFISAFFWLMVISFDVWRNFCSVKRNETAGRFLKYFLLTYGATALCTLLTWMAQEVFNLPLSLRPGIGGGQFCWLDLRGWQAMIYFFGPLLITTVINVVLFSLTALRIRRVQREMAKVTASEESAKNLRKEKSKFWLFLRLFLIMGVTWSVEVISYFTGWNATWTKVFYITDVVNTLQGVLIFILFVLKKSVREMLAERFCPRPPLRASQITIATNASDSGRSTMSKASSTVSFNTDISNNSNRSNKIN